MFEMFLFRCLSLSQMFSLFYVARAHSEVSPDKTNENYISQGITKTDVNASLCLYNPKDPVQGGAWSRNSRI